MFEWILFVLVLLLGWWWLHTRVPAKFPPGPGFPLPIIGHAHLVGKSVVSGFGQMRKQYGDIFGLFLGPIRIVVISSFDLIQEAMNTDELSDRPAFGSIAKYRGGLVKGSAPGVLAASGQNWSEQRRFTLQRLRDFGFGKQGIEDLIAEEVEELCRRLEKESAEGPLDVRRKYNVAILNALWRILTNERLDYEDPKLQRIVEHLDSFLVATSSPLTQVSFMYSWLDELLDLFGVNSFKVAADAVFEIISEVTESHESTYQEDSPRDFIDVYMAQRNVAASDPSSGFHGHDGKLNMKSVLLDMFIAGSETTSTALNWATLLMAKHPEIQEKIQKELDEVTGHNRVPTWDDRTRTPFTEATILEIHRLASMVTLGVPHGTTRNVIVGGYVIPAGTQVFTNLGEVMLDPSNFPDPHRFDPTRFLDASGTRYVSDPKVIPFGLGKRRCLGETLARMELYRFFTGVLHHFNIRHSGDGKTLTSEANEGFVRSPKNYTVKFEVRK